MSKRRKGATQLSGRAVRPVRPITNTEWSEIDPEFYDGKTYTEEEVKALGELRLLNEPLTEAERKLRKETGAPDRARGRAAAVVYLRPYKGKSFKECCKQFENHCARAGIEVQTVVDRTDKEDDYTETISRDEFLYRLSQEVKAGDGRIGAIPETAVPLSNVREVYCPDDSTLERFLQTHPAVVRWHAMMANPVPYTCMGSGPEKIRPSQPTAFKPAKPQTANVNVEEELRRYKEDVLRTEGVMS